MLLILMVEVMFVLRKPTSTPQHIILAETVMIWGLVNIIVSAQDTPWCHHLLGVIKIILLVIIRLLLVVVVVKVVWVLGTPTLPTIKLIVVLMLIILCHLRVDIIHS